jgi:hypothetical protein
VIEATYETDEVLDFADGRYRFWMTMPEVNEFERKHGSLMSAHFRLHSAIGFTKDREVVLANGPEVDIALCRDLIRLSLIGGAKCEVDGEANEVGPQRARELVDLYTYPERPIEETAALAWQITAVAMYGRSKLRGAEAS